MKESDEQKTARLLDQIMQREITMMTWPCIAGRHGDGSLAKAANTVCEMAK